MIELDLKKLNVLNFTASIREGTHQPPLSRPYLII
jgi:hypothetical protein